MAAVDQIVGTAVEGRGSLVLVLGEAGIGKTRLLDEAAGRCASAGMTVVRGRAVPAGGAFRALTAAAAGLVRLAPPADDARLRPYRAVLGRLLPDFSGSAGPESVADSTIVIAEGILRLLLVSGGPGGCALLLDDLHWADPETLAVVEYLSEAVADEKVVVCAAARDHPRTSDRLERTGRAPASRVLRPARLDDAQIAQLAGDRAEGALPAEAVRFVTARSDGLPLLVEELTAGWQRSGQEAATPVPATFRALVKERLGGLTAEHRRLLEAAAVVGTDWGWNVIAAAAGLDETATLTGIHEAAEADLLRVDGSAMHWRHALTRDAVLAAMLPPRRTAIAVRAATLLDTGGAGDSDARAADLLAEAGEHQAAGVILLRLARHDMARGALGSAERHLARVDAVGPLRNAWAVERIRLLTMLGRVPEAVRTGTEAIDGAVGDDHAELCLQLARGCVVGAQWSAAVEYVDRAGRPDDPRSGILRADAAYGAGDPQLAAALAERAATVAERTGDNEALTSTLLVAGRCLRQTDPPAAEAAFSRAVQIAAEHGLVPLRVACLIGLATVESLDRPDPPALAAARELAESAGLLVELAGLEALAADLVLVAHGPDAAEPVAMRSAELAGRLHLTGLRALAELLVAAAHASRGDEKTAHRWLEAACARANRPVEVDAGARFVRAIGRAVAGDLAAATRLTGDGVGLIAGHGSAAPTHWWGLWLLLCTVTREGEDEARRIVDEVYAGRRTLNRGALAYADAILAARAEDAAGYADALARADALTANCPHWQRMLRLLLWEAAVTEGWGDPVAGLRSDLAWHERLGDEALARRCRDLLRAAGSPPRRTGTTPVPPGLRAVGVTARESEILTLVVEGLTNPQIAERLFLSARTVETHVSRLLAKTGAADRGALRTWAGRAESVGTTDPAPPLRP